MTEYTFSIPCQLVVSYLAENEQEADTRVNDLIDTFNYRQNREGFNICGENHWLDIREIPEPTVEEF